MAEKPIVLPPETREESTSASYSFVQSELLQETWDERLTRVREETRDLVAATLKIIAQSREVIREADRLLGNNLPNKAFDPETLAVLNATFEGACADLGVMENAHHSREFVAKKVLELSNGERDPAVRCVAVVALLANNTPPKIKSRRSGPL